MAVNAAKFEARLETLASNGHKAARDASKGIEHYYKYSDALRFVGGDLFRQTNVRYWDEVERFKSENKFKPDTYINNPKIAALTVFCALTTPEPLFVCQIPEKLNVDSSHFDYCYIRYSVHAMIGLMDLDIPQLGDKLALYNFIREIRRDKNAISSRPTLYGLCMYMSEIWPGKTLKVPTLED